jgi:protein-tyrosine phosphatase
MHIIYNHSSGGQILQSGALEIPGISQSYKDKGYIHTPIVAKALKEKNISMVALTAGDFQVPLNKDQPEGLAFDVLHIPFADSQTLTSEELEQIKGMVLPSAAKMAEAVRQGRKVLSTCWAGINRSSLLTIHTLKLLEPGLTTVDIVLLIRKQRYVNCLNNVVFQDIVYREAWG